MRMYRTRRLASTRTLELNDLNREVLFTDTEDLEVAEDRLLGFGMTVNPHTQEVSLILPVEFTLRDTRLAMGGVSEPRYDAVPLKR